MFGQMAKWVAQIDRADRLPEFVSHAFHVAVSGRPGPVVLALPEDMLRQPGDGGGCQAIQEGEAASGRVRHGAVARHVGAVAQTAGHSRRWRLVGTGVQRHSCLHRSEQPACRMQFPPAGPARQPAPELLRRGGHRHQPLARGTRAQCRLDPGDRPAARRDDHQRIHPVPDPEVRCNVSCTCIRGTRNWVGFTRPS